MRTNEARAAAVRRRAAELERQARRRRGRAAAALFCVTAGLGLTVWAALAATGAADGSGAEYGGGLTASIFSGGSLGYLAVGLLAFALGACVTLLCLRLRAGGGRRDD